jgi:hypothetical protein
MFVKGMNPVPPGVNPLRSEDRMPVLKVVSGDTWIVDARLVAADCGQASPQNSHVEFVLSENQFSPPIWTGEWMSGVYPDEHHMGLVHVKIPRDVTKTLRRGSYMFSLRVSDRMRYSYDTQLSGYFLVEYMPTSDQHSIPYRDGTSEMFANAEERKSCDDLQTESDQEPYARDGETGLKHKIIAVTDKKTGEVNIGIEQQGVR